MSANDNTDKNTKAPTAVADIPGAIGSPKTYCSPSKRGITCMGGFQNEEKQSGPEQAGAPPLVRLNHVSFLCTSVEESVGFYRRVLGFELVQRPASLDFRGAWLHKYDMGIHLLQRSSGCDDVPPTLPPAINSKGNHISFQCSDMALMKARLRDMDLELVTTKVWDGDTVVEQLFFHDPDGNVIEICNCDSFPVVPLAAAQR